MTQANHMTTAQALLHNCVKSLHDERLRAQAMLIEPAREPSHTADETLKTYIHQLDWLLTDLDSSIGDLENALKLQENLR